MNNQSLKHNSADSDLLKTSDGDAAAFVSAKPIWPENRAEEKNLFAGFRAEFDAPDADDAVLRITGASVYRIFLNGKFFGYGPARGPHGWNRIDEWPLKDKCRSGRNVIAIEIAGYNVNSYYLINQPAFLQAEVVSAGNVVASTAGDGIQFQAQLLDYRSQKVQRYSFQRPFSEAYKLTPSYDGWRNGNGMFNAVKTAVSAPSKFLPRIVPFPSFEIIAPAKRVSCGTVKTDQDAVLHSDRSVDAIGEKLSGYLRTELTSTPWFDVQRLRAVSNTEINTPYKKEDVIALDASSFEIFDFDYEATGFPGASISSSGPATVYFVFDEILSGRDVSPTRMGSCNVIAYELSQAGEYHVEAFEPYSMRYCKIIVIGAACGISGVYLREYVNPEAGRAAFKAPDAELNRIFEAARTTFKENAVDGFMDCPSRERAGWLCDSFFTARVSSDLTGNMKQEKIFLQNFMIPKSFEFLPEGMLPMCYPADHNDGIYIPNWAMWFVLELEEYLERSGDRGTVDALRPKVLGLIRFLQTFRNSDGLLERLPQCVFIEWSRANSLVQDVSYPTNMTYAEMLSCAARMYGIQSLEDEAENVRGTVRGQSFNGKFFVDNAIRRSDGSLAPSGECTEVCQYYAFFFKTATVERYPELWETLRADFGPQRRLTNKYPDIAFANAFIGNYLRFELLSRQGLSAQILDETKGYFLHMTDATGTLWENDTPSSSCCHGFASHVAHILFRDVLGIRRVDAPLGEITVDFADTPLAECSGSMPVGDEMLTVEWKKAGGVLSYNIIAPRGFSLRVMPSKTLILRDVRQQSKQ